MIQKRSIDTWTSLRVAEAAAVAGTLRCRTELRCVGQIHTRSVDSKFIVSGTDPSKATPRQYRVCWRRFSPLIGGREVGGEQHLDRADRVPLPMRLAEPAPVPTPQPAVPPVPLR